MREHETTSDKLDTEERRELDNSEFGLPQERAYPMPDAAHVRAAEAYFRFCPEDKKTQLAKAILAKAAQFGVTVKSETILAYANQ